VKAALNDMAHLKKFVKKVPNEQLEKVGLTMLGENEESARSVFTSEALD
jgi:hypothetical protein